MSIPCEGSKDEGNLTYEALGLGVSKADAQRKAKQQCDAQADAAARGFEALEQCEPPTTAVAHPCKTHGSYTVVKAVDIGVFEVTPTSWIYALSVTYNISVACVRKPKTKKPKKYY